MGAPIFHASTDRELAEQFALGQVQWLRKPGDGDRPALSGIWTVVKPTTEFFVYS